MVKDVISEEQLRAQMKNLARAQEFARSDRLLRFLHYVISKTLEGDMGALRERQIGIAVFDRPHDWDPKVDNIVRSEARRLRLKLESYARNRHVDEIVRITMPTGGYGVQIEKLPSLSSTQSRADRESAIDESSSPEPATTVAIAFDTRRTWRNGWRLVVCGCLALFCVVVFLRFFYPSRYREDDFTIEPFSSEAGLQFSPAVSPDNKQVAFVWNGGGNRFDVYSKTIGSPEARLVASNALPGVHPAWSPDGKQLAFFREAGIELPRSGFGGEAQLVVVDLASRHEKLVLRTQDHLSAWASSSTVAGCQSLAWEPSSMRLIFTDPSSQAHGLIDVSLSTAERNVITKPSGSDQDCSAHLSPDGKTIAFVRFVSHAVGFLYTVDLQGSHLHQLTNQGTDIRGLDWTPDGKHLVFAAKERGTYQLRMASVTDHSWKTLPAATASATDPSISRDGKFLVFVENHENWNIWRVPLALHSIGTPQRFIASTGQNHSPSYSPDGRSIAFVSDRSGNPEIWLCDLNGQHFRKLTEFAGPWLGALRWSPDGSSLVFDARPKGHSAIFKLDVRGGKPELIADDPPYELRRPSWSRNGEAIYFDTTRGGAPKVLRHDLKTKKEQIVAPAGFRMGVETEDRKRLIFQDDEQRRFWSSDLEGNDARQVLQLAPFPGLDWTVGGKSIYFALSVASGGTDLYKFELSTSSLNKLGHLDQEFSYGTPSLVVSPDEHTLLFAATDNSSSEIKLRRGLIR